MSQHDFPQALVRLLGFEAITEPEGEWICMTFVARDEHTHSDGSVVQGGLLAAWMDHAMARAAAAAEPPCSLSSLEIKTAFLSRVGPGRQTVRARFAQRGRRVAFLEAEVRDPGGRVLASATSTAMIHELT